MELGHRAEIVSQTVLIVERKEGGFESGSQICRVSVGGGLRVEGASWGRGSAS